MGRSSLGSQSGRREGAGRGGRLYEWLEEVASRPGAATLCLAFALLSGAILRFSGLDWDAGQHLHPDERFLTMVETALRWPSDLAEYFDASRNPLSPYNHDYGFFVYGTLPLYLVKWLSIALDKTGYDQVYLVGRALSGLFDLGCVVLVYLLGRRLYGLRVGLFGATLLSLSVLNIQQSHFFTVDTFASFFALATVYLAVRASEDGHWWDYALMGLALGAAVASKLSLFNLGLVAALAAGAHVHRSYARREGGLYVILEQAAVRLLLAALLSVLFFRVAQPISFEGPSVLNFSLNEQWLANMREIGEMVSGERDMPPSHQWTNRAMLWFPWQNMVLWGMGLPLGLAAWAGWGLATFELVRKRRLNHLLPVVYVALVFLYQGTQFVKTMRYFLPIYPLLALFAAYLLVRVWDWAAQREQRGRREAAPLPAAQPAPGSPPAERHVRPWGGLTGRFGARGPAALLAVVVLAGTLLYALAFASIYWRPHSRVEASRWMYANIPKGATLANEHWDDALPLRLDGKDGFGGWFKGVEIPNYHEDTPEKLSLLVERLTQADYVVLSSNRLYDSIPRLPMRYPMATRYYELLFAGQLGFSKVAEFTSYPQLLGVAIPDQSAEEAFSVYDHPKVTIFKKTEAFAAERVRHLLGDGIDWDNILRLRPVVAAEAPTGLNLSPADASIYQAGGTWAALYDRDALSNRLPLLAWALALAFLGLLATPLVFLALGGLADRGYAFGKALGLLAVGWGAWLVASGRLLPFGPVALGLALLALACASGLALWARRAAVAAFCRQRWRLLLAEEALFWGAFLAFAWVRAANPDLWHPAMGGEKPMDLAFLNAVAKSTYFPPYDPWFAGGYINYYYFGFVLVASLVRLTGIVPHVAYNLAVPTFFALTAVGAFSVALSLADSVHWLRRGARRAVPARLASVSPRRLLSAGLAGALFVTVLGNLGEFRLILEGLQDLARVRFQSTIPGLAGLVSALDGARHLLAGQEFRFRPEWWYWNASRLIPHPPSEAGAINEFPYFTFLFADLHAHMMALPYTILALAFAVSLVRAERGGAHLARAASAAAPPLGGGRVAAIAAGYSDRVPLAKAVGWLCARAATTELAALSLPALVIGALWPMNTWDFPTYAVLFGVALACREYRRAGRVDGAAVWGVLWRWGVVLAAGYAFFLPFHRSYASAYGSVELWHGSRTPLSAYLLIHGLLLFLVGSYLVWELLRGSGHNSVVRLLRLALRRPLRLGRARGLYRKLARPSPWHNLAVDATVAALLVIVGVLILWQAVVAVAMVGVLLAALLALRPRPDPARQFALCLVGLGFALTAVVEVVVLKGDISRMNTVFKFYLQVWVLWGIAGAAALPSLLGWSRGPAGEAAGRVDGHAEAARPIRGGEESLRGRADAGMVSVRGGAGWGALWRLALGVLLALSLMYPVLATWGRINDRFDEKGGLTLDGMAYMANTSYADREQKFALKWDKQAIEWLQDNVEGSPVILEAATPIYRWGSRVSIYTGLPTVLGWDWHEKQQRAILPGGPVERRANDVRAIYADANADQALYLLRRYGVAYVYVGPLERAYYPAAGLAKFERYAGVYWDLAYENAEVKIYRLRE